VKLSALSLALAIAFLADSSCTKIKYNKAVDVETSFDDAGAWMLNAEVDDPGVGSSYTASATAVITGGFLELIATQDLLCGTASAQLPMELEEDLDEVHQFEFEMDYQAFANAMGDARIFIQINSQRFRIELPQDARGKLKIKYKKGEEVEIRRKPDGDKWETVGELVLETVAGETGITIVSSACGADDRASAAITVYDLKLKVW
jgi:hypothetical protein